MKRFTSFRIVETITGFPENPCNLKLGTQISAASGPEKNFGLEIGDSIPIFYNGAHVYFQNVTWTLEQLATDIEAGIWKIGEACDLEGEELDLAVFHHAGMVTPENFWRYLWPNVEGMQLGERFVLRHEPSLDPEFIRMPAKECGVVAEIHMKIAAAKQSDSDKGVSMVVSAGDEGFLSGTMNLSLDEVLSGDAFCIVSVTQ